MTRSAIKSVLTTISVVAFGFGPSQAQEKAKDLQLLVKGEKPSIHQVAFCYRPESVLRATPGHSFIVIGKWTGNNPAKLEMKGFGFYPKAETLIGYFVGPGDVEFRVEDKLIAKSLNFLFQKSPNEQDFPTGSCRVLKHISEADYKTLNEKIDKWKNEEYHLKENNCNTMAGEIAKAVGLQAPDKSFVLPRNFMERLWDLNRAPAVPTLP